MIGELEVRKELVKFLSNEISLDQFEDWLASKSWDMHKDSIASAQKLVSAIELRLAEYSSGHGELEALRAELVPYATEINIFVSYDMSPTFAIGASSSVTIVPGVAASPATPAWCPILSGT